MNNESGLKLIGGKNASDKQLSSMLWIPGCTGVLVAPQVVMTAAHCVHIFSGLNAGRISGTYSPGRQISIGNGSRSNSNGQTVTIAKTLIHPSWEETCTAASPCDPRRAGAGKNPAVVDLALILLSKPVQGITPAMVDTSEVKVGDGIAIGGYGCEGGISTGSSGQKKYQNTIAIDGTTHLAHPGSQRANGITETLTSNFITPAQKMAGVDSTAGLCPGDSGGPAYRFSESAPGTNSPERVVGIHADYTFKGAYEAQGSTPMTNIHVRLDASHIKSWFAPHLPAIQQQPEISSDIFMAIDSPTAETGYLVYIATDLKIDEVQLCMGETSACSKWDNNTKKYNTWKQQDGRKYFASQDPLAITAGKYTLLGRTANGPVSVSQSVLISPKS